MLKDITIGQYLYGTSPLHRMNPAVKTVLTVIYAAAVFWLNTPAAFAVYSVFTALLVPISRVPSKMLLKGFRPLVWIFALTTVFNLFLTPGSAVISWHIFTITREGITAAALLAVRLILLVAGTSLLTLTTSPLQLMNGIEKLLSPLKHLRVPVADIAMMISIALRFIPIIADEAERLMMAQKARGADMESGSVFKRIRAMLPVMVPLLTGVFRRADELAEAMDARCYGYGRRTKMKTVRAGITDIIGTAVFAAFTAAAIAVQLL